MNNNNEEIIKAARAVVVEYQNQPDTCPLIAALGEALKKKDDAEAREEQRILAYRAATKIGRRVRVVKLENDSEYILGTRSFAQVGQIGTVVNLSSQAYSEYVHVKHDDNTASWYHTSELEDASNPVPVVLMEEAKPELPVVNGHRVCGHIWIQGSTCNHICGRKSTHDLGDCWCGFCSMKIGNSSSHPRPRMPADWVSLDGAPGPEKGASGGVSRTEFAETMAQACLSSDDPRRRD